jgi:hypothetical protein
VHPYVSQALAAERIRDYHNRSQHASLVRWARQMTRRNTETAVVSPAPQTKHGSIARLVPGQRRDESAERQTAGSRAA